MKRDFENDEKIFAKFDDFVKEVKTGYSETLLKHSKRFFSKFRWNQDSILMKYFEKGYSPEKTVKIINSIYK